MARSVLTRLTQASFVVCVAAFLLACSKGESRQPSPQADHGIVILPNSVVIRARGDELSGVDADGKVKWTLKLEPGELVLGNAAAAPNSTAYVRTTSSLRALSPTGEWLWKKPLPPHTPLKGGSFAFSPAAMTDSSAVVLVEGQTYRSYSPTGEPRWDLAVEASENPRSAPQVAADGQVYLNTDQSLYAVLPTGKLRWRLAR